MAFGIDGPWAKLVRDPEGRIVAALSLTDHCLDTGVVFEALLPAWLTALEAAAGRALTSQDRARLTVLVALHDLGKANPGFQARSDPRAERIGHTRPVAALLFDGTLQATEGARLLDGMLAGWTAGDEDGDCYLAALMAHHGRPLQEFAKPVFGAGDQWRRHVRHWRARDGRDPVADVVALIGAVRARWPLAWAAGGGPLPGAPRFVALFAGLVTLADWLASNADWFPVEGPHGDAREAMRRARAAAIVGREGLAPLATPATDFTAAMAFTPFGFQTEAAARDLGPIALIEAETGSGKTEAALWRWLELRRAGLVDSLYFALPTRTAAVQLYDRVKAMLHRVWGADAPEAVLAVPGYLRDEAVPAPTIAEAEVRWDEDETDPDVAKSAPEDARWAAARANRFLAARVAVGTIDQALLATLPVKHALFRASVLARSLLVVDEVHASDAYMTGLLKRLLDHHVAVGGHALLLSATLGGTARANLLGHPAPGLSKAEAQPYPAISGKATLPCAVTRPARDDKAVTIETAGIIADAPAIARRAVAAARAGAAVLVVRNTVRGAIAVAQAIAEQAEDLAFRVNGVATVHHGRFARDDRVLLDAAVERAFGKGRGAGGRILVGTQTLEQSLDIDADHLITDLAPMDVLLQRIGRLHRHDRDDRGAFAEARALVLRPEVRDLSLLLETDADRHGMGGRHAAYPDLLQLEATLRLIEATPDILIPRDNRRLVERALHPEALAAVADEGGGSMLRHRVERGNAEYSDAATAARLALDLTKPFTQLSFLHDGDVAATRLGARDLLVDLSSPLDGPFGHRIDRIAVPGWMASDVGPDTMPETLGPAAFRLRRHSFTYDRWGLAFADPQSA